MACGTLLGQLPNGGRYRRCVPQIEGPRSAWMVGDVWQHFYQEVEPPPAQVVLLRDATVRGPGVITLPGDIVVAESLINSGTLPGVAGLRRVTADRLIAEPGFAEGVTGCGPHVLLKQLWDANYGHWLIEGLPRVALLDGLIPADSRFIVSSLDGMGAASAPMRAVMAHSLGWHGVRPEQIVVTGWDPVTYSELVYPLPLTVQPWVKAPCVVRMLEALGARIVASSARGAERLFVRRPDGGHRRLCNEEAVASVLAQRGYVTVMPGAMEFADQVCAFSGARRVVATLGAECANLAFAPSGVRLFGLAPAAMQDDFFYDLVSHKGGEYFCLHGQAASPSDMNAAFSVDLGLFQAMLDRFER